MSFQDIANTSVTPFLKISQDAVRVLESITPADKAQAVPVCKFWRVDPRTGKPFHPDPQNPTRPFFPVSAITVSPPSFGTTVTDSVNQFRERPPVSFERATIVNKNPRGLILYREVHMSFVVHRPDVIFGDALAGQDNWSDLIVPGNVFNLRYGWSASSGVKNDLLTGVGTSEFPGTKDVRFVVVNYTFSIQANFEIRFEIFALEDGELQLRQTQVVTPNPDEVQASDPGTIPLLIPEDPTTTDGKKKLARLQDKIKKQLYNKSKSDGTYPNVKFRTLLDLVFSDALTLAFKNLGYSTINLYLGNFNHRAGFTTKQYGASDQSDRSIGDFLVPIEVVEKTFGKLIKNGKQITIYNFIQPFLLLTKGDRVWDISKSAKAAHGGPAQKTPNVMLKTALNPIKNTASVYIVDLVREYTRFVQDDTKSASENVVGPNPTKQNIREKLANLGIPILTFMKGNSYIQAGTEFHAINDDQIKSIFIRRNAGPETNRKQKTKQTDAAAKQDKAVDPRQLLYSSALQGEVPMIGNFAFDTFGLFWLDFGVPRWNGPFFVMEKTDTVERGNFTTLVKLVSEGDDPLGTQRTDARNKNPGL